MALEFLLKPVIRIVNLLITPRGECKFAEECKKIGQYRIENFPCSKNSGMYYGGIRPGGCYRKMQEYMQKEKQIRR